MIDLQFAAVSKKYRLRREADAAPSGNPLARALRGLRRPAKEFWALREVSFEVRRGEALGIIGPNGAGKSTILKLLSNITTPTSGEIRIHGSLSALIEVGSGFHPELTGRENIYLNGSILGMRRREISRKLDAIVDFAEVRSFLDIPVKRYSSGMYVRLGFSIAAHLEPDILLLDEVLAVGDLAFQAKCLRRIEDLRRAGTTIVFISHDLGAVQRLCGRALLLRRGEIVAGGPAAEVVKEYQQTATDFSPPDLQTNRITKEAEITSLQFFDAIGRERASYCTGESLIAKVGFLAHEAIEDCVFQIIFYSSDGVIHCEFTTAVSGAQIDLEPGRGMIEFKCEQLGLQPGLYYVDTTIRKQGAPAGCDIDWQCRRAVLRVDPGKMVRGWFYTPHYWRHERTDIVPCVGAESSISEVVS